MEERNCYVYEDYRGDNGVCFYVGKGSRNEEKGYDRSKDKRRNKHHDRIMNKHGYTRVIVADNLTEEEAHKLEEERIYLYVFVLRYGTDIDGFRKGERGSKYHLTNQTWGGEGIKGCNPYANKTEEEMKEIAKKKSETWNNKTEEEMKIIGKKISEVHKGKHLSEETKQKLSELNKGEKNPMYGKGYKISGEKNPMYGRTGEESPRARKVKCLETGEIFTTVKEASEWSGTHRSCIAGQIRGKQKSAGKHPVTGERLHWKYVD